MYPFSILTYGLTWCLGFLIGSIVYAWTFHPAPEMAVYRDDTPPTIPVVVIDGIQNSALVGSLRGNVRLLAGGRPILASSGGVFAIHDTNILTNVIESFIPTGMQFVASKRGKKYYPVASASAAHLSPANRVYFPNAEAAERAGFKR